MIRGVGGTDGRGAAGRRKWRLGAPLICFLLLFAASLQPASAATSDSLALSATYDVNATLGWGQERFH